jgi:hypothetical protein
MQKGQVREKEKEDTGRHLIQFLNKVLVHFSYFSDWLLNFCPGPASEHGLPTTSSLTAGIIHYQV